MNSNNKNAQRFRVIAAAVLSATSVPRLARLLIVRNGRFALAFHDIIRFRRRDLTPESQYGLTMNEFERILIWLKRRFRLLSLASFLSREEGGVLLTFDDGKANNFTNLLPILEKYQAPAVFFVSTQHVLDPRDWLPYTRQCARTQWSDFQDISDELAWEYYNGMSPEQITHCGQHPLITLGAHTVSHPFLTACDDQQLCYELGESKRQLEIMSGQPIEALAYPGGDYDRRVAQAARDVGYRCAFVLTPQNIGLPQYEIPRIYIGDRHLFTLSVKLSGLHLRPLRNSILVPQNSTFSKHHGQFGANQ